MNSVRSRGINATVRVGLFLLIAANVLQWVLTRHSSLAEDPRDLVVGLMFGLAIGTTVLGLWQHRRAT